MCIRAEIRLILTITAAGCSWPEIDFNRNNRIIFKQQKDWIWTEQIMPNTWGCSICLNETTLESSWDIKPVIQGLGRGGWMCRGTRLAQPASDLGISRGMMMMSKKTYQLVSVLPLFRLFFLISLPVIPFSSFQKHSLCNRSKDKYIAHKTLKGHIWCHLTHHQLQHGSTTESGAGNLE